MVPEPATASWPPEAVYALVTGAALVVLVVFWIWYKGRKLPGDRVFRASRWGRGNHLFPSQVVITPDSLTLYTPQWIGKQEQSIHMAHVASIKIDTNLLFSDIWIESSGGQDPIVCHGHSKGDAVRIKAAVEALQSAYYRKPPVPPAVELATGTPPSPADRPSTR